MHRNGNRGRSRLVGGVKHFGACFPSGFTPLALFSSGAEEKLQRAEESGLELTVATSVRIRAAVKLRVVIADPRLYRMHVFENLPNVKTRSAF